MSDETISQEMVRPLLQCFFVELIQVYGDLTGAAIRSWWDFEATGAAAERQIDGLMRYCKPLLMPHYMSIIFNDVQLFSPHATHSTRFLPGIDFRDIWFDAGTTQHSREALWKHLTMLTSIAMQWKAEEQQAGAGADAGGLDMDMMQCVDPAMLEAKLQEIQGMLMQAFGGAEEAAAVAGAGSSSSSGAAAKPRKRGGRGRDDEDDEEDEEEDEELENLLGKRGRKSNVASLFDPERIMEHLRGMTQGKLGSLAAEFCEEAQHEFGLGDLRSTSLPKAEAARKMKELFESIFRQPAKMAELVKRMQTRIQTKIDSGELSQSEMIQEAQGMMQKMGDIPGLDKLFKGMGMGGAGGKMDLKATQAALQRKARTQERIDRMKARAEHNLYLRKCEQEAAAFAHAHTHAQPPPAYTDDQLAAIFSQPSKLPAPPPRRR